MRRQGAHRSISIIATIGWSIILVNVALFVWGTAPLSYPQPYLPKGRVVGGIVIVPQNLVMLGGRPGRDGRCCTLFFTRTVVGQALRATAENPVAAQLMGIRVERMMTLTFLLSGFLAGGAGVLVASIVYANFDLGLIGIKSFAAAVLGGFGQVGGAMAGGLAARHGRDDRRLLRVVGVQGHHRLHAADPDPPRPAAGAVRRADGAGPD